MTTEPDTFTDIIKDGAKATTGTVADTVADGAAAVAEAAAPVIKATASGVSEAGLRMNELGKDAGDWWNQFTTGMDGWDIAGTGIIAILGWLIGNAFGGGGLMGLIIGTMLVIGLSTMGNGQLGKNIGEMLRGEPNTGLLNGPEVAPQPEVTPGVAPPPRTEVAPETRQPVDQPIIPAEVINEAVKEQATRATRGTDFNTGVLDGTLMLPPREQPARTLG